MCGLSVYADDEEINAEMAMAVYEISAWRDRQGSRIHLGRYDNIMKTAKFRFRLAREWITMQSLEKLIIGVGTVLIVVGFLMWFLADKLSWFGSLPGDLKFERNNFRFYAPITTMVLISLLLSFL